MESIDYEETFSPMVRFASICLMVIKSVLFQSVWAEAYRITQKTVQHNPRNCTAEILDLTSCPA